MKKRVLPFLALGLFLTGAAACKKCTTCSYKITDSKGVTRNHEEEYCGKTRQDLNVYKSNAEYQAKTLNATDFECD